MGGNKHIKELILIPQQDTQDLIGMKSMIPLIRFTN